jgi:hypothetical protein
MSSACNNAWKNTGRLLQQIKDWEQAQTESMEKKKKELGIE